MNRSEYDKSEYLRLRTDPEEFFQSGGADVLFFSREAARRIIEEAAARGWEILGYDGGILTDESFQARLDAIWHRYKEHFDPVHLEEGNLQALAPLDEEPAEYNAFVITGRRLPID